MTLLASGTSRPGEPILFRWELLLEAPLRRDLLFQPNNFVNIQFSVLNPSLLKILKSGSCFL